MENRHQIVHDNDDDDEPVFKTMRVKYVTTMLTTTTDKYVTTMLTTTTVKYVTTMLTITPQTNMLPLC